MIPWRAAWLNEFMHNVIEVDNLKKIYPLPKGARRNGVGHFEAVAGVSFNVAQGEIFGIRGPNGAGKATTLEILEGLKKPTSGEVKILGFNVLIKPAEIKKRIGVQLQSSAYLDQLSLAELLEFFASLYRKQVDVDRLLDLVSLKDKKFEQVKNLSGGQKQRFTLIAALVNDPEILFLDEPTTGMDPRARREVWQLVREINKRGVTVVVTTHYMEEAEFLCNRVGIMDSGKILAIDEPHALISHLKETTQVSFFVGQEGDFNFLEQLPSVAKVHVQFPKVILEVHNLEMVNDILLALKNRKVAFSAFTVKTGTLEEVYLSLTGKEFVS